MLVPSNSLLIALRRVLSILRRYRRGISNGLSCIQPIISGQCFAGAGQIIGDHEAFYARAARQSGSIGSHGPATGPVAVYCEIAPHIGIRAFRLSSASAAFRISPPVLSK